MKSWLFALLCAVLPAPAWAGGVAVLYFDNQGNPELEPLRVGLTQMFVTDLAADPKRLIVERTRIQEILDELKLGHSGRVDPATSARIGQLVGAEYLVLGTYFELGGTLRIDARVVRVETGEVVVGAGRSGALSELFSIEKSVVGALAAGLDATLGHTLMEDRLPEPEPARKADAPAPGGRTARPHPDGVARKADPVAATMALSRGLVALDAKDPAAARAEFEAALTADPSLDAAKLELSKMAP
jgi:TolB-like protein